MIEALSPIKQLEALQGVDQSVAKCFSKQNFETFGEALSWWQNLDFEIVEKETRDIGRSEFSMDILWLISQFGPNTTIDKEALTEALKSAKKSKKSKKSIEELPQEVVSQVTPMGKLKKIRRKQRRRRA